MENRVLSTADPLRDTKIYEENALFYLLNHVPTRLSQET